MYAAKCSPDSPYCVAVGGAKDGLRVVGLERIDDGECTAALGHVNSTRFTK